MKPTARNRDFRGKIAFSLVEVVMALGIITFSLTALLGLMPVGLSILRTSIETSVRANVTRQIISDLQQTPFREIDLGESPKTRYFTEEGVEANNPSEGLFEVRYTVSDNVSLMSKSDGSPYTSDAVKKLAVRFYTKADQAKRPAKASYTNFAYIVNNGL